MKKTLGIFLLAGFLMPVFSFANDVKETMKMSPKNEVTQEIKQNKEELKNLDIACVQKAISVREDALSAAFDTFTSGAKTALTARKDALVLAWSKTDAKERRLARQAAYDAHKKTMKSLHETLKTAKKSVWTTFNTSMKSCGASVSGYNEMIPMDLPTSL